MIQYFLLIVLMTLTASFASFFLKKSSGSGTIVILLKNMYLYFGGLLYLITSLLNIWLLKRMPYSIVVPSGSICYIWTMIIAGIFLKEKIGIGKIIGVLFIISGVICIAI